MFKGIVCITYVFRKAGVAEMKRIYGINGSPRKNKNTAQLIDQALAGAKVAGAVLHAKEKEAVLMVHAL